MAALGAPEVISQLESAAKVLMVRNTALFCSVCFNVIACECGVEWWKCCVAQTGF